ncbi:MAG: RluA family pseudouridine synthase [Lachnospiraceae bacterium]|nr:RluA family pseudouridine synthase [Lachnospiraceae bacterium]
MKRRLIFAVTREMAGKSIRQFLQEELSFSAHQISRLKFQEEGIRIGGEKVYVSHVLKEGEILTVGLTEQVLRRDTEGGKPAKIWEAPAPELSKYPLQVLYEDGDLLIVNKPAGMVCHPSPGHYSDTLANQAAAHLGGTGTAMDMRVTGRLDRETSGIVTFARNSEAAAMIQRQREDGRLVKIYLALAEGRFDLPEGVVDFPLRREAPGSHLMICAPDGKAARTFYKVLAETRGADGEPRTLLACRIEHGRTHQIRVHMARIGHPLAGDPLYGKGISREAMGLHAWKLSLQKPFGSEMIEVTAERPDWAAFYLDRQETGTFGKSFV